MVTKNLFIFSQVMLSTSYRTNIDISYIGELSDYESVNLLDAPIESSGDMLVVEAVVENALNGKSITITTR